MILPITLTTAAACALINIWLAMRIVRLRLRDKVLIGTGGSDVMEARTRAQANFVEYAPFFLILLAGIELAGGSSTWLWIAAVAFVLARIVHPIGLDRPAPNPLRAGGALATWVILLLLAGWAMELVYTARQPIGTGVVVASPRA